METKKVKCSECGFLARMNPEQQYCEVPQQTRESGHYPFGGDRPLYCIKGKRDISKEVGGHYDAPSRLIAVIQADYACDGSTPYRPSFSPKEHMQMSLDEAFRKESAERLEKDRQWREEIRQQDIIRQKNEKFWDRFLNIAQSVVTTALIGMLGYFAKLALEYSHLPKP